MAVKIDEKLLVEAEKALEEGRLKEWLDEEINKYDINYALCDFTVQEIGEHMKVVRVYIGQREEEDDTYDCYFIDVINFLYDTSSVPIVRCFITQWSSAQDEIEEIELVDYRASDFNEEVLAALLAIDTVRNLEAAEREMEEWIRKQMEQMEQNAAK